ncbi:MAG: c-type cytochrome biogenesis protein CcmI [Chloroflexi bacterium]|jgi:cytochrome c-type biogenesis protein CcmI|nr:c-type cytochrome biogenesis protein CcmI [Chloroflexota bacterium]
MVYLIGVILFLGAALFVGYPLFKAESKKEATETNQETQVNQAVIRSMLEELELDYEMGNISEEDCRELDAKYRAELN